MPMPQSDTSPLIHTGRASGDTKQKNDNSAGSHPSASHKAAFLFFIAVIPALVWIRSITIIDVNENQSGDHEAWFHSWEAHLLGESKASALKEIQNTFASSAEGKLNSLFYFNNSAAFAKLQTNTKSTAQDFYHYQEGWEAQITQSYCAVATSAAVLNSLRGKIDLPQDEVYIPYPWATQKQLLRNEQVKQHIFNTDTTKRLYAGLSLSMAADLLNYHVKDQGFVAEAHHMDPSVVKMEDAIETIKEALMDENERVMINYDRGGIGQGPMGHGHFSPIGAYSHEMDAFLVMDVAKYKHPSVWVPTARLFHGISTVDNCATFSYPDRLPDFKKENLEKLAVEMGCKEAYRGFIVVKPVS